MQSSPCVRLLAASTLALLVQGCSSSDSELFGAQPPVSPPPGIAAPPYTAGLLAASATTGRVHVHWSLPGSGFEAALFQSEVKGDLYAEPPVAEGLTGSGMELTGLTDGVTLFFGLGVRAIGASEYSRTGVALRARPALPLFVDAAADPAIADGMAPATAFADLASALAAASQMGAVNVLVKNGIYDADELLVPPGVHLYGGFDDTFALPNRGPGGSDSSVVVAPNSLGFLFQDGVVNPGVAVLDGFAVRGGGGALGGIEVNGIGAELRSLTVGDFTVHGIMLRNPSATTELGVQVSACVSNDNRMDGMHVEGAFDLRIHGSTFDTNGGEGLDASVVGLGFERARVVVEGSLFFGNGTTGASIGLDPLSPPNGPSGFDVRVRASRFERNGVHGLVVAHHFEGVQGYDADVLVLESLARANRGRGMSIDAAGEGGTLIHRCLATANGFEGYYLESSGITGFGLLSASAATANLGAGARSAGGAKPFLATHCVFAGNLVGGLHNNAIEGATASSVAYLQREPFFRTRTAGTVEVDQALTSTFVEIPEFFTRAIGQSGSTIRVQDPSGIFPGAILELADGGQSFTVVNVIDGEARLSPTPPALSLPAAVAVHPSGLGVVEDYRLPVGSPARDAGLSEPMAPSVDAGIFGSPDPGDPGVPAVVASQLFYPIDTFPSLSGGLPRGAALEIRFNRMVAPSSVLLGRVRAVTESGIELSAGLMSVDDELILLPPGGDWGLEPFVVELHLGLTANDGATLTTPMILPIRPR